MNEKHLSLFTRVEDGLPEKEGWYFTIDKNYTQFNIWNRLHFRKGEWTNTDNDYFHPQYWLNLDTLTTKQKAIELAEVAYGQGKLDELDCIDSNGVIDNTFEDFINQNKDRL